MEGLDFSKLLSSQPELYLILAALVYAIKKVIPLLRTSVETQKSHLECLQRIEQKTDANTVATQENTMTLKTLLSKDDAIDLLLHRPKKKVLNGSGSIAKQSLHE